MAKRKLTAQDKADKSFAGAIGKIRGYYNTEEKDIARALSMSPDTLKRRKDKPSDMTVGEVQLLCKHYPLASTELLMYVFPTVQVRQEVIDI